MPLFNCCLLPLPAFEAHSRAQRHLQARHVILHLQRPKLRSAPHSLQLLQLCDDGGYDALRILCKAMQTRVPGDWFNLK